MVNNNKKKTQQILTPWNIFYSYSFKFLFLLFYIVNEDTVLKIGWMHSGHVYSQIIKLSPFIKWGSANKVCFFMTPALYNAILILQVILIVIFSYADFYADRLWNREVSCCRLSLNIPSSHWTTAKCPWKLSVTVPFL